MEEEGETERVRFNHNLLPLVPFGRNVWNVVLYKVDHFLQIVRQFGLPCHVCSFVMYCFLGVI